MAPNVKSWFRGQLPEGKAFPNRAELMDPTTTTQIVQPGMGRRTDGRPRLTQREAKHHLEAYGGSEAMDWLMDCVRYLGDTVANADFHFQTPKGATPDRGAPATAAVSPPGMLAELFDQPNPHMDYVELMELLIIDLILVGNAYWFKWRNGESGKPLAIYRLAPPYVKVVPEPWGVGAYEYEVPGFPQKLTIDPGDMIHFKLANPHSPYYGLGLIQGAGRAADLELALADSQASYFENHAMPSLGVQTERRVPRDVMKKLRAQLRSRTSGPANAGELLVLEAGLKLAAVAPNAADAAFAELSRLSRDRIFSWFRMSPKLLGIMDETGGTDKIADAQRTFDNKAARPLMNKLQRKISRELVRPGWNLDYRIDYEYVMPIEDQVRLVGQFSLIPGVTVDEVRSYMNLGPHPDKTIGSMTLNLPGEEGGTGQPGDTPTRAGFPDRGLPGEAGRPPKGENTKAFPRKGGSLPAGAKARRPSEGKASIDDRLAALVLTEEEGKAVHTSVGELRGIKRPDDTLADRRAVDVDAIIADAAAALAREGDTLERALLDRVEGKAGGGLRQRLQSSPAWRTFKERVTAILEATAQRALSAAVIHHADLGDPAEEIDYDSIAKRLVHRQEGVASIQRHLKDDLIERVRKQLLEDGEENRDNLERVVREAIANWRETQSETVALTEAVTYYNEGTLTIAEETGHAHVSVSDGTDHDQPCKDADGSVWTIAEARERPLEHPRCRRAFVPVPLEA